MTASVAVGFLPSSVNTRDGCRLGGWTRIKDPSDPHVTEIAKFAVSEYNRQTKAELQLEKVVSGETQVVAGVNYRLVLIAKDGTTAKEGKYEAVVWEKAWEHWKQLLSFKLVIA